MILSHWRSLLVYSARIKCQVAGSLVFPATPRARLKSGRFVRPPPSCDFWAVNAVLECIALARDLANDESLAEYSDLKLIAILSCHGNFQRRIGGEAEAQRRDPSARHVVGSPCSLPLLFNERRLCQLQVDEQTKSPFDLKEQCRFLPRYHLAEDWNVLEP